MRPSCVTFVPWDCVVVDLWLGFKAPVNEISGWKMSYFLPHLQVLFVDYGNVAMLSEERCAELPRGLANISAFAYPCCLDKIKPLQGSRWGTEASQVIETLTQHKGTSDPSWRK